MRRERGAVMSDHTPGPFTDEQAEGIRSMAVYWREVRGRDDQSPLHEEAQRVLMILGVNGVLSAVEFCADPCRIAASELLKFAEDIAHDQYDRASPGLKARADELIAKAKGVQ